MSSFELLFDFFGLQTCSLSLEDSFGAFGLTSWTQCLLKSDRILSLARLVFLFGAFCPPLHTAAIGLQDAAQIFIHGVEQLVLHR